MFINARLPSGTSPSGTITTQQKFTPEQVWTQSLFCHVCQSTGYCIHEDFAPAAVGQTIPGLALSVVDRQTVCDIAEHLLVQDG